MRGLTLVSCAAIGAALLTTAPAGAAIVLPDASVSYNFGLNGTFGKQTYSDCGNSSGNHCSITVNASFAHGDMTLSADATSEWPIAGTGFSGQGNFYFEVLGPQPGVTVPIDIL